MMRESGLDAAVLHNPDSVFDMTDFSSFAHERPFILVLLATGNPIFVAPRIEEPHVRSRSVGGLDIAPDVEFPRPWGPAGTVF